MLNLKESSSLQFKKKQNNQKKVHNKINDYLSTQITEVEQIRRDYHKQLDEIDYQEYEKERINNFLDCTYRRTYKKIFNRKTVKYPKRYQGNAAKVDRWYNDKLTNRIVRKHERDESLKQSLK